MTAKHTPGPWYFNPRGEPRQPQIAAEESGRTVAIVYDHTDNDAEKVANAHLIAAAPDLLAALGDALGFLEGFEDCDNPEDVPACLPAVRAALAKAEGTT